MENPVKSEVDGENLGVISNKGRPAQIFLGISSISSNTTYLFPDSVTS